MSFKYHRTCSAELCHLSWLPLHTYHGKTPAGADLMRALTYHGAHDVRVDNV
ncbi:hypothetical protein H4B97_26065, partial [Pseudomonas juntendi]|nr:hypothetical protein [Pseudomonas juntendi]